MRKKIYIAYTGGTIGMQQTDDGYKPMGGYLAEQMEKMPELNADVMPEYTINEYPILLDSADMSPIHWSSIARDIEAHYDDYDGFVVLHGTDTMAYTASALSFMLQHLDKPVIITGSQIPLCEVRNDARENIITALAIAANFDIPEVCLFFGNKLYRGCRTVKVSATGFAAFDSPNFAPLGVAGIRIKINWDIIRPRPTPPDVRLRVQPIDETNTVAALRIFPGISGEMIDNMLQPPLKGLVLEAYGVGNGPVTNKSFMAAIERAIQRDIVIVNCSQCLYGGVTLDDYATGKSLAKAGVLSGHDMTVEAALSKMLYLFSYGYDREMVRAYMQKDLRGELTSP